MLYLFIPFFVLCFALAFFLAWLFLVAPSGKGSLPMIRRYAHRGLHGKDVAENSLSAFRAACDGGYGIELDVRLSSDGVPVVFHDETLLRATGEDTRVDSLSARELSRIEIFGTGDTVPTFSEVLSLVDGRVPLLVELKEDAFKFSVTEAALDLLSDYRGEYIIESFNPLALARVKKKRKDIPRGILSKSSFAKDASPLAAFVLKNFLSGFLCRPNFIAYRLEDSDNASFRALKKLFKTPSFAYTVTSHADEERAFALGYCGVIFEGYIPNQENSKGNGK